MCDYNPFVFPLLLWENSCCILYSKFTSSSSFGRIVMINWITDHIVGGFFLCVNNLSNFVIGKGKKEKGNSHGYLVITCNIVIYEYSSVVDRINFTV